MDVQRVPAEANELENSLARWAARLAAVLLVASMAAMPSVVAWLDEDAIAARPAQPAMAAMTAPEPPPPSAEGRPAAPRSAPTDAGEAQAGLWSPAADRVSAPVAPPLEAVAAPGEAAGYGAMSDEEWLAHVMQSVGERANRTVAAAFRAMDGWLFENRPAPKGSALLPPPPVEIGPPPGGLPAVTGASRPSTAASAAPPPAARAPAAEPPVRTARAAPPAAARKAASTTAPAAGSGGAFAPTPLRPAPRPLRQTAGATPETPAAADPAGGEGPRSLRR